jgi:hypothetical protein
MHFISEDDGTNLDEDMDFDVRDLPPFISLRVIDVGGTFDRSSVQSQRRDFPGSDIPELPDHFSWDNPGDISAIQAINDCIDVNQRSASPVAEFPTMHFDLPPLDDFMWPTSRCRVTLPKKRNTITLRIMKTGITERARTDRGRLEKRYCFDPVC